MTVFYCIALHCPALYCIAQRRKDKEETRVRMYVNQVSSQSISYPGGEKPENRIFDSEKVKIREKEEERKRWKSYEK